MALPRVLILNQPFVSDTGGGITLSNLFAGWDTDKLAVACSGYIMTPDIDPKVCNNYYQLGGEERKWVFPFNLLSRKYLSGQVKFTDRSKDNVVAEASKSKTRVGFIMKYFNPFLEYSGLVHFITKTSLSAQFRKWLDDYNPDVVYAQCSSRESILFCIAVNKYLNKPSVFHMMDDWPSLIGVKGFMSTYWKNKIDKEFRILLDDTHVHLGISDYMAQEYKNRYGKEFIPFHNPIDLKFWQSGQKKNYKLSENPTILYAGRIGLGIDNSLMTIAEAIKTVNTELQLTIKFAIQAQASPAWIKEYEFVKHREFVPYEELPHEFGSADFLILPYDFSPSSIAYIKYSMPTKASEYMASGTPILIYAPEYTALVQYAKRNHWATIVENENVRVLADEIRKLVTDQQFRQSLAETAKKQAEERHDSQVVTLEFQKIIANATKIQRQ
ncbi:hypothetical protein MNBD_BACTEROID03-190 [hydrothermal vent metagenome]|uniref:Glycosyl transferase family 1 domain-containing protein n=1 Tax=hydrothermal vent metagenome TaxID=652676 RepID=A0A3B0TKT8_9ZZZZ